LRNVLELAARVKLLLMDVDGVLTDGRISFIEGTAEAKTYDVKDGIGLSIARRMGLRTGVLSGRGGAAVVRRAEELGLHEVHLRVRDKLQAYDRIVRRLKLSDAQVCYIGDDLTDVVVMHRVGLAVATANARYEVKQEAHYVTHAVGGSGAVREVVELILKAQGCWEEILKKYEISSPPGHRIGFGG